jgi:hypothetical protein
MKEVAVSRGLSTIIAYPAMSDGEQGRMGYGRQDKSGSLWRRRSVVLSLIINIFGQAAKTGGRLSISTSCCSDSSFFTSSSFAHVS